MNESDASSESGAEDVTSVHSNDHDTNCLPKGSTSFTAYVLHNILQLGLLLCIVFFNYSKKKTGPIGTHTLYVLILNCVDLNMG